MANIGHLSSSRSSSQSRKLSSLLRGPLPVMPHQSQEDQEPHRQAIKHYCTLYPCYFSSSRTKTQGRRVSKDLAVPNPLAYNLLMALRDILDPEVDRITLALEPDKTHPKDWSNPGRVRVQLFDKVTHKSLHPVIKSKQHLFIEVAKYLQKHPTQKQDALKIPIPGLSVPEKFLETEIAQPRGWTTMNQMLPLQSSAVSGGGVRDDFFKEALEDMRQIQTDRKG